MCRAILLAEIRLLRGVDGTRLLRRDRRRVHDDGDERSGGERERADCRDRHSGAEQVGHDSGRQRADGVAKVAPEAINAERTRPPRGMGRVRNRRDQRRVDHGSAEAEKHAREEPPAKAVSD